MACLQHQSEPGVLPLPPQQQPEPGVPLLPPQQQPEPGVPLLPPQQQPEPGVLPLPPQQQPEPGMPPVLQPRQQPEAALPPPPPPLTTMVPPNHLYQRKPLELQEEVEYLLQPFLSDADEDLHSKSIAVSCVLDINPVIQDGPMCGLVALSMASQLLHESQMIAANCHPDTLLNFAKESGFSKQGEMFSVDYMLQIAKHHMDCCGRSTHVHSLDPNMVILSILQREAILVPYDADKNHSPCLAKGHKAHWCILVGFAGVLNRNMCNKEVLCLLEYCTPNPRLSGHYQLLKEEFRPDFARMLSSSIEAGVAELYVFARHGKSRHIGLWSYRDLQQSNGNLMEVGPRISYPGEYIVPHGGINEGLCSKVLVLSKQK